MIPYRALGLALTAAALSSIARASNQVPTQLEEPGTQPLEAYLEPVTSCSTCHGGYDKQHEPLRAWQGSMMAHAARDPLFWAALAVAEQDFVANETAWTNLMPASTPERGGAGEYCLRCHTPGAWVAGRSTPTNGSALAGDDFDGVSCDTCHRLVDPVTAEGQALVQPGRQAW